jgi:HPt (histidine-containing phosphotransfer) domain-containing protein
VSLQVHEAEAGVLVEAIRATVGSDSGPQSTDSQPASVADGCLDRATLDGLRELERASRPGLLLNVIQKYLVSATKLQTEIHEGLASGDAPVVNDAAHALKSSSAQLGALSVSELARSLEKIAGEASTAWLETAPALVDQLDAAFADAVTALEELVSNEARS